MTPIRRQDTGAPVSRGLLIVGMHRSGTSLLARIIQGCGVDIGRRLLGGSTGNEHGHWEDAFAVELHERLLSSMGRRWDTVPVPSMQAVAASVAEGDADSLVRYMREDRARQPHWAVKDPRLSLFARLWIGSAVQGGTEVSALLMVRHPVEVAQSLAVRDGIPRGQGLLLWLDYTLAALERVDGIPLRVATYDELMASPAALLERIRSLPGWEGLSIDARAIEELVRPDERHHTSAGADDDHLLPKPIHDLWRALQSLAAGDDGIVPTGFTESWRQRLAPFLELADMLVTAWRVTEQRLWERVARAESAVAQADTLERQLLSLEASQVDYHEHLVRVLSDDIRRMQQMTADSQAEAARLAAELATVRQAAPGVEALTLHMAEVAARNSRIAAELHQAQRQLESILAERDALVDQVAERQRAVETLAGELQALVEARTQLVDTVADRQSAVVSMQSQLDEHVAARAALVDMVAEWQEKVDALASEMAALASDRDRLVGVIAERQSLIASMRSQMVEQSLERRELEQELAEAKARVSALLSELHAVRHQCSVLSESDRMLRQVVASRSWSWTRPLRVAMRWLRGDWGERESQALRGALRRLLGRSPALEHGNRTPLAEGTLARGTQSTALAMSEQATPAIHLAEADEGLPDVFVWAVIDWHFRMQRPQHLARSLAARGHRVFYVSNNFVDSRTPGFHVDPLDGSGRLFQVQLNLKGAPAIYFGLPSDEQVGALHDSLARLLGWTHSRASISLVQHPYWSPLLRSVPNARVVYDCMDHHGGFDNNAACILEAEEALIRDAELVIVTSTWLEQEVAANARATAMIRNAGEYDFFSAAPADVFRDPRGRKVIGYYGAIAEWFDLDLVRSVATAHPDTLVLLVGNDTAGAAAALADLPNVELTGEVPYARLPYYLHGFDVALLPFKVIPLTLATNPVKVYEYLAAGTPVVTVDLPEMTQFDGLVTVAGSDCFADAVGQTLLSGNDPAAASARRAFAAGQTWDHRAAALDQSLAVLDEPVVSVVVLAYNNLAFTEACLFSIEAYSDYPRLEVIVVDNASTDGSPEWLRRWEQGRSAAGHSRRLILNRENLGFSAGNNVGLAAATGEVLILLNNDTYVTPGWVRTLSAHLRRDGRLGLVGPVTNNIGNEARIEIAYADLSEMIRVAGEYTRAHPGRSLPMRNAAFFCVAMRREVYEQVGGMDEAFGVGFFEDDDYCRRVEKAGYSIACAEDVFVHHHLSASFDQLKAEKKQELFNRNKEIYEAKWGPWVPHVYRANPHHQKVDP